MKTNKGIGLRFLQFIVLILITASASAQLKAGFQATPSTGCPPMVVTFQDTTTGNPNEWKWDLGNGTVSFLKNPIATYFNPGTYTVKLIVKNATGADTIIKSQYITVNAKPTPAFAASDSTGCFPLSVKFSDKSTAGSGNVAGWQWDFGDGTLSTEQNPTHTYTSPGSFTVILKVTNSNGCTEVITKPTYIKIQNGVKADFSFSSLQGCHTPAPVTFTNKTSGTGIINYSWSFGDGNSSILLNPINVYANSGSYSVRLIASTTFGCADTMVIPNAVNIGSVKADFTGPVSVCVGATAKFINASTPNTFIATNWSFSDGTTSDFVNAEKVFSSPGVYKVKLFTDFGACQDSATKTISVLAKPTASFTAANTTACKGPLNVTFTNTSGASASYVWHFGDNSTSTFPNPVHTYTNPGVYTVSLIVTNAAGCTDTIVKQDLVRIVPAKILSLDNLNVKGCIPLAVSPTASVQDLVPGSTYLWDFGDGKTGTGATPTHNYTTQGVFNVKLTITSPTGCVDTLTLVEAVKAGVKPSAEFSATPRNVCAFSPVTFTDLSTNGPIQDWFWTFGDGTTSAEQSPIHAYTDTGKMKVTLIVYNFGCADTIAKPDYIYIMPPIAKFDTAFLCNTPMTRNFIDNSIGANTWDWKFGDGTTSNDQNPTHTYAASGTYPVELTVSNGACNHVKKTDVIVIKEHANLQIGDSVGCLGARILFNAANVNAGNIALYSWYFDGLAEGPIVTGNNPIAWTFNEPGNHPMALVTTDVLKCRDTTYAVAPFNIYGPRAKFGSLMANTCYGNTINLNDSSKTDGIHPIVSWSWDYGEGTPQSYTAGPFSHDYTSTGNYNITLKVKDSYGCSDSLTKPGYVSITKPVAKFTISDSVLCPATPVSFTNESTGEGVTYTWDFGDGTTSNDVSPVHSFVGAGTFNVKMVMKDKNGCGDSATAVIKVFTAHADFDMSDSVSTCPPLVVNITNKSSNYISLNWDFGDGGNSQLLNPSHIYTYPGNYSVKLTIVNNGGCTDTMSRKVIIQGPTGVFQYTPKEMCSPSVVNYKLTAKNTVSYIWDYNDGTTIFSTKDTSSHIYTEPGMYLPKVIIEDVGGCRVAISGLDTLKVFGLKTGITSTTRLACDSGFITFNDSTVTNDVIAGYMWNFGDGTSASGANPTHYYSQSGNYNVKLVTTTRFGCVDSTTSNNFIKVVNSPKVAIGGNLSACEPAKIKFAGQFVRADTSAVTWSWNFGNGNTSNLAQPDSQLYSLQGSYNVGVKVVNSSGCFDTVTAVATVHPIPVVDAGIDTIVCRYSPYTLNATGAATYTWTSNPSLSCSTCASPNARPDSLTTYYVEGKTAFGCTASDSVTIRVKQPFKITTGKGDTICIGKTVPLKVSGADKYDWSPSLWLNNTNTATPTSKPDSSITYRVIGSDNMGCFKDTSSVKIKVYSIPKVEITNGASVTVQVGNTVKLSTKSSSDVTTLLWSPAQFLSCGSCAEPVASPRDNVTYTVTATNAGKCSSRDEITVNVICGEASVFIPNTFSPNGDGANDVFFPRGKGLYNIKSLKIFNRWGQCVFDKKDISANNPADGWDGTTNGVQMPTDVYVYVLEVICANNITFPFKGNVSLLH